MARTRNSKGNCNNNRPPVSKRETRKNSTKSERRAKEAEDTVAKMSKENPYEWHSKFKTFSDDAANFPFATPLARSLGFGDDRIVTPGVMEIRFIPTIGYSADQRSPINRSASRFRTYLRSVQKASADYDSADIMIILMAVDSLLMFHQMCTRAYDVCQLYTPVNKYYPDSLLLAMGIDPSIKYDLSRFRLFINQLGINLTRFIMPDNFDINYRHQWMCEGLYLDADNERAQTYLFVPEGFWQYSNTGATGSKLIWKSWFKSPNTTDLDGIIQFATSMLNALSNDDDVDIINGDLYSAYGSAGTKGIKQVADLETVIPVYDPVVLSMIENATLVGGFSPTYTPEITQDPSVNGNGLIFQPTFAGNTTFAYAKDAANYFPNVFFNRAGAPGLVMNMHLTSPSSEAVMEASRLMVCSTTAGGPASTAGAEFSPDVFGSDVACSMNIWYYSTISGNLVSYRIGTNGVPRTMGEAGGLTPNLTQMFGFVMPFDWAPFLWGYTLNNNNQVNIEEALGDLDNATFIAASQLNNVHEASLLSLFDVPEFAGKV